MRISVGKYSATALIFFVASVGIFAQVTTSSEVMRERVSKAKAYVAVKNYNAAIYELEGIRRETVDPTVQHVADVILMNCFLEQGDYKRAQNLLTNYFEKQKINKKNSNPVYFSVAGQIVKSAKTQLERYRALGLNVMDRNLPVDAVTDLDNMRRLLEVVIEQSKLLSADPQSSDDSFALLEESSSARSGLARDDFDSKRWKNDVTFAREHLADSKSIFLNAADDGISTQVSTTNVASNGGSVFPIDESSVSDENTTDKSKVALTPLNVNLEIENRKSEVPAKTAEVETAADKLTNSDQRAETNPPKKVKRDRRIVADSKETNSNLSISQATPGTQSSPDGSADPVPVGSLIEYATQKINPVYPTAARTIRMGGVVRVDILVSEEGKVASVQSTTGPAMLQRAALDAVMKWKFKPFTRDGQPVKATGFVNFSFNL